MKLYFGDDSAVCTGTGGREPNVFLFGGYYVDFDNLKLLESRIAAVKAKYGCPPEMPVKWNFRDLYSTFKESNKLDVYNGILAQSDALRTELLSLLEEVNAFVLLSAIRGHSPKNLKARRDYYGWGICCILQRLGFDGVDSKDRLHFLAQFEARGRYQEDAV